PGNACWIGASGAAPGPGRVMTTTATAAAATARPVAAAMARHRVRPGVGAAARASSTRSAKPDGGRSGSHASSAAVSRDVSSSLIVNLRKGLAQRDARARQPRLDRVDLDVERARDLRVLEPVV